MFDLYSRGTQFDSDVVTEHLDPGYSCLPPYDYLLQFSNTPKGLCNVRNEGSLIRF